MRTQSLLPHRNLPWFDLASKKLGPARLRGVTEREPGSQIVVAQWSLSGYPDNMSVISSKQLSADPLDALREIARGEVELDHLRCDRVKVAREKGATWEQISEALGMSRQSVWEYFTSRFRIELSHRVEANSDLSEDAAMQLAVDETQVVRRRRRSS